MASGAPPSQTNKNETLRKNAESTHQIPMRGKFLQRDELYQIEKPYAFKFPADSGDNPSMNMKYKRQDGIVVSDMRGFEKSFTIDKNGFTVLDIGTDLKYEDYHSMEGLSRYIGNVESLLMDHLGAKKVQYFRHAIRKRHPTFPIPIEKPYEYDQPTNVVHVDTSTAEAAVEVRNHCGEEADALVAKRFQWFNVWKPLRGPSNDWPLVVGDAATFSRDSDFEPSDLIYTDHAAENMQTYFSPNQRWYYLSNHKTSEAIIFKQADSQPEAVAGVPHCSCANPLAPEDESPRESIEVRVLVFYDE